MIYPVICTICTFKGEVLAPASDAHALKCPQCGAPAEQDYSQKNIANGNREFRGQVQESVTEWYHPKEVQETRRELGKSGECVQGNGTVKFKDRQQQRQYMADKRAMKRRFDETGAAKKELAEKRGA